MLIADKMSCHAIEGNLITVVEKDTGKLTFYVNKYTPSHIVSNTVTLYSEMEDFPQFS